MILNKSTAKYAFKKKKAKAKAKKSLFSYIKTFFKKKKLRNSFIWQQSQQITVDSNYILFKNSSMKL